MSESRLPEREFGGNRPACPRGLWDGPAFFVHSQHDLWSLRSVFVNRQPPTEPGSMPRPAVRVVRLMFVAWFALFGMVGNLLQPSVTRSLMEELAEHTCSHVAPRDAARRNARSRFTSWRKRGFVVRHGTSGNTALSASARQTADDYAHRMRAGIAMRC